MPFAITLPYKTRPDKKPLSSESFSLYARTAELGLGLFLFGLLNPVIESMRGLCAASRFRRVQKQVCGSAVSLGSSSEAQMLVEPELLEKVFEKLVSQCVRRP